MPPTAPPAASIAAPRLYRTENLAYTKHGLIILSLWLLGGDFAFQFFETVFGRFIPLYLKSEGANNTLIGMMMGSIAGVINMLFLPNISRWNDNLRTPLGRRIPLLRIITPLTALILVGVGFGPEIGVLFHGLFGSWLPGNVTKGTFVLGSLCVFIASYHFANMLLINGYNWLIRDVYPLECMSRFLAWMGIAGNIGTAVFLWFVFPHLMTYRHVAFIGVAVFYVAVFMVMRFKVKEGEYPPVAKQEKPPGLLKTYAIYFRECFQISIYRNSFFVSILITLALSCAGNFTALFAKETLGIDMKGMGHIFAWSSAITIITVYPIGYLCDRFSPLYLQMIMVATLCIQSLLGALLIHGQTALLIYSVVSNLGVIGYSLSGRAVAMNLFPAEKFGQFSGALNVFNCGILIFGNIGIGYLMDFSSSNYRLAYYWTSAFSLLALIPMAAVIRDWKKLGGREHYKAPLP
jgi:maltose/moltooligosaccharide transporter